VSWIETSARIFCRTLLATSVHHIYLRAMLSFDLIQITLWWSSVMARNLSTYLLPDTVGNVSPSHLFEGHVVIWFDSNHADRIDM